MAHSKTTLISRIGETDQLFVQGNTPNLALERAELRLALVELSQHQQEKIHFLQEAIVLLEQGRVEFEEMPMALYLALSIELAKAYMCYFQITKQARFALITQQILKPLTSLDSADVFFYLAYASVAQSELALTRHWLKKYFAANEVNLDTFMQHDAFKVIHQADWLKPLIQRHLS